MGHLTEELAKASGTTEAQAQKVLDVLGFSTEALRGAGVSLDQVRLEDLRMSTRVAGLVVTR